MKRALFVLVMAALAALPALAQKKEADRLEDAGQVMKEILGMPEGIPQDLLDKAECVLVFPSVKKFAIGIGGSYGRGAMLCRSGENFTGPWGPPSMYALEGGNIGLQLGGEATDFVLLVMNPRGADSILRSKTKLGADASAAAGPKGRTATAATDAFLRAEVLTWSRSRGLFAGVSLEGSTLRADNGANENIYGKKIPARDIVLHGKVSPPAAAKTLIAVLDKRSPKNLSDPKSLQP
jgi:lipid-binding SYLF domain-containing protein